MDIDSFQAFCKSLPAVTDSVKWDHDLVFSVGDKMFCVISLEPPLNYSFKVKDESFEELSFRPGFIPAPYMARAKWLQVTDPSKVGKEEREAFIRLSYELVKAKLTKKRRQELGI